LKECLLGYLGIYCTGNTVSLLFVDCCLPSQLPLPLPLPPLPPLPPPPSLFPEPPLPPPFRRLLSVVTVLVAIVIVKPVVVVNNDAMPGPRRSLHCRSLPSLFSCFLHCHCWCLCHLTVADSAIDAAAASAIDTVSVSAAAAIYQPPWS
jgi:hypothetical protein